MSAATGREQLASCAPQMQMEARARGRSAWPISHEQRKNNYIDKEKDSARGRETLSEMSRRVAEADRIDCLTSPDQLSIKAFL